MMSGKDEHPVSRIGNERNPRLIILLLNPAGCPEYYLRFPEYTMRKDKVYKPKGMHFCDVRKYCEWWDKVLYVTDEYIDDSDVLALEYYPYHTPGACSETNNKSKWNDFAHTCLAENKDLLKKHIANGVPVFGYYWGNWFNEKDIPELSKCLHFKSKGWQSQKLKDLKNFMDKHYTKNPNVHD